MKLIACYIVKNEIAALQTSLASLVLAAVDRCIIINTEANREIRSLAEQQQAAYFIHPWQEDFSAARNFALQQVPQDSDWILFLDADEYFADDTAKKLRRLLAEQPLKVAACSLRLYHRGGTEAEILGKSTAIRLFRYRTDLHYVGRIHEQPYLGAAPLTAIRLLPENQIVLYHTGYQAGKSREKAARNLVLLQQAIADGEEEARLYGYLAEAYEGLGDRRQALHFAVLDIEQGVRPVSGASRSWRVALRLSETHAEKLRFSTSAVENFPAVPEFRAEYAVALAEQADYDRAVQEMRQAISDSEAYRGQEPSDFDAAMRRTGTRMVVDWQQKIQQAAHLKLAACVICRNEEKNLPQWLAQMTRVANACIVVDTGSNDATVKLARAAGAQVFTIPWTDDFAAARNTALEHVPQGMDWILFLDADEYFTSDSLHRIRYLLAREQQEKGVEALLCRIINIDADADNQEIDRFVNVRIFRAEKGLRYKGCIHEQLVNSSGGMPSLFTAENELVIFHTGYSSGRIKAKLKRNLVLLQQDIAVRGEQPAHYAQLVDCYFGLGVYDKAVFYARKQIAAGIICIGREDFIYDYLIRAELLAGMDVVQIQADLSTAETKFPQSERIKALQQEISSRRADKTNKIQKQKRANDMPESLLNNFGQRQSDSMAEIEKQQREENAAAVPIHMQVIQKAYESGNYQEGYQQAVTSISKRIQEMMASLIMPGVLDSLEDNGKLGDVWGTLTEPMRRILQRYFEGIHVLSNDDYDTYIALLPAVIRFCPAEVLHRYVVCGYDFSDANYVGGIAVTLYRGKKFVEAAEVFDECFALDEEFDNQLIFLSAGIVYYNIGRYNLAKNFFERVASDDSEIEQIVKNYLYWIEERLQEQ